MKHWAPTISAMSATCLAIVAVATVSVAANEFVREREKTLNMRIASVESDVRELTEQVTQITNKVAHITDTVAQMTDTQAEMLRLLQGLAAAEQTRTEKNE